MEPFVLKTLQKIRKEAPRRLKDLRNVCDDLIDALSENQKIGFAERDDMDADKYFDPLQAACESRYPKLMEIALDAVHFLIERGYLRGNKKISGSSKIDDVDKSIQRTTLMDQVIETVAKCSEEFDDNVHLQVIKVLLVAVTSPHCQVHEASLLLSVRSCFHIHLVSKNQINKTTAKASLVQMLSVVFQRMESLDADSKLEAEAALAALGREKNVEDIANTESSVPCGDSMYPETYECLKYQSLGSSPIPFAGFGSAAATTGILFPSIQHKDAFLIFRALCKLSMKGIQDDSGAQSDPIALQNKILSLEMILYILQRSGPAFKSGEKFIYAVRQYLCVSLLGNCTSNIAQVTGLALHVFVALLECFKDYLKAELEVFVTNIFLRILESENSTFEHKLRVLEVFHNICKDPRAQVELFINYDCDLEAIDLFRRIIDAFAKTAKHPAINQIRTGVDFMTSNKKHLSDENTIRSMGVEGLVIILRSLMKSSGIGFPGEKISDSSKPKSGINPLSEDVDDNNDVVDKANTSAAKLRSSDTDIESENSQYLAMKSYDKKQRVQEEIESGILKFNMSPKKGLSYLISLGHVENSPSGVAKFFRTYQDRLDKTLIGDYLGREREYEGGFCLKVLHEYVDSMDFSNVVFDEAIRLFLGGFRLPGEAQKIDRLMEKFAERYYLQNRNVFASADMAFILAFSTIMLQTNLHNPAIRDDKRMTKEQFVKQNTGISSDGELPEKMLLEIYDRIQAQPISLAQDEKKIRIKREEQSAFSVFSISSDKKRKDAFNDERKEMVRASEAIFKQKLRSKRGSLFVRAAKADEAYARPMFEVAWAPMISCFSQILESFDDKDIVGLCLEGFYYCIRLSGRLDVDIARNTFVNSLVRFTSLEAVREMNNKCIEAICTLVNVSLTEGDFLMESWEPILRCLSLLSRLLILGQGKRTDDVFFADSNRTVASIANIDSFTKLFHGPTRAESTRYIEDANALMLSSAIDPVVIDRIFLSSSYLSSESVQYFVKSLCAVSMMEISVNGIAKRDSSTSDLSPTPRVFSLQKLVEVADCNMYKRSRFDWRNMWNLLADHFTLVGCHDNYALAMYAIDSLKQLSIKFLQKDELTNFNFQRLFLKPFEIIMTKSNYSEIKELILRCLDIMILACAGNIRSGWKSIFSVFAVASSCDKIEIARLAFDITERLMTLQFDLLILDFVELMNCLVAFTCGPHDSISLRALSRLYNCAEHLARGAVQIAIGANNSSVETSLLLREKSNKILTNKIEEDDSAFRMWWPLLLGLSTRVSDVRLEIRMSALDSLYRILSVFGNLFSIETWEMVFKGVLFPIMDSAKVDNTPQPISKFSTHNPIHVENSRSWISSTAPTAISVIVKLYIQYSRDNGVTDFFLEDIICLLEDCITHGIELLSRMCLKGLRDLIQLLPHDENPISLHHASLVASKLSSLMLTHLWVHFGHIGSIALDSDTPNQSKQLLLYKCYFTSHSVDTSLMSLEYDLNTPYGPGKFLTMDILDGYKSKILLTWGAFLYTYEKYQLLPISRSDCLDWQHCNHFAVSSTVYTLDLIEIMGITIQKHFSAWNSDHLSTMLNILEACYHHARCFNNDSNLRQSLAQHLFMSDDNNTKGPHLLEQEISAACQLLRVAFQLYNRGTAVNRDVAQQTVLAEQVIQRITTTLCSTYVRIDSLMQSECNSFLIEQLNAYAVPLKISLKEILNLSHRQFISNIKWICLIASDIVSCSDRSIRLCIQELYKIKINPELGL